MRIVVAPHRHRARLASSSPVRPDWWFEHLATAVSPKLIKECKWHGLAWPGLCVCVAAMVFHNYNWYEAYRNIQSREPYGRWHAAMAFERTSAWPIVRMRIPSVGQQACEAAHTNKPNSLPNNKKIRHRERY